MRKNAMFDKDLNTDEAMGREEYLIFGIAQAGLYRLDADICPIYFANRRLRQRLCL
jgi:hypothetical protein